MTVPAWLLLVVASLSACIGYVMGGLAGWFDGYREGREGRK